MFIYMPKKLMRHWQTRGEPINSFSRAAMHRSQPYLSAKWGGDPRSTWSGLEGNHANGMRCGFMGFPVWGSDVGGYVGKGEIPDDLYIRWLQYGAWSGLFEVKIDGAGGKGKDRLPWNCSEKVQQAFRDACALRMHLLPTIYSAANTSYKNGVMMKPMQYVYPNDPTTLSMWDQYIFCDQFLVAPIFISSESRDVYFPKGEWINYYNLTEVIRGPQEKKVVTRLDQIPVYLKANSITVRGNIINGNKKLWSNDTLPDLEILVIPGNMGENSQFDYVDVFDNNREKILKMDYTDHVNLVIPDLSASSTLKVYCAKKPSKLLINGKQSEMIFDTSGTFLKTQLPKGKKVEVTVAF